MSELISIVIPTYNRPIELERCLTSVMNQSYANFEVLVVNDSTDEAPVKSLIDRLNDKRIRYFPNQRSKGANGARNTGVLNAGGNYITFLDDDDEWYVDKLKMNLNCLSALDHTYGVVISACVVYQNYHWKTKKYKQKSITLQDILLYRVSFGSSSNLFFRRSVFEKVGLWDEDMPRQQDLELMVRVLSEFKCAYQPEIMLKVHGHNIPAAQKAFDAQQMYVSKITPVLNRFSKKYTDRFYAYHYRLLTLYSIRLKDYQQALGFMTKGLEHGWFYPKKDLKLLISLMTSFVMVHDK